MERGEQAFLTRQASEQEGGRVDSPYSRQVGLHDADLIVDQDQLEADELVVGGEDQALLGIVIQPSPESFEDTDVDLGQLREMGRRVTLLLLADGDRASVRCEEETAHSASTFDQTSETLTRVLLTDEIEGKAGD